MSKLTLQLLVVLIARDSTVTIPVTCLEYELPVLEEIHGEDNVSVSSSKDVEIDTGEFSAADAYAQLLAKYSQHQDAVKQVYRTPKSLARESGLPYKAGDDASVRRQAAVVIHHNGDASDAAAGADAGAGDDAGGVGADDAGAGAEVRASARAKARAATKTN